MSVTVSSNCLAILRQQTHFRYSFHDIPSSFPFFAHPTSQEAKRVFLFRRFPRRDIHRANFCLFVFVDLRFRILPESKQASRLCLRWDCSSSASFELEHASTSNALIETPRAVVLLPGKFVAPGHDRVNRPFAFRVAGDRARDTTINPREK